MDKPDIPDGARKTQRNPSSGPQTKIPKREPTLSPLDDEVQEFGQFGMISIWAAG